MAGILHTYIPNRVIDDNGISDGATIAFYLTGTLTPATIYADSGLTTPRANPIVVPSGAEVPDVYLDEDVTYRRIVTYADGSTTDTDPYDGLGDFYLRQSLYTTGPDKGSALIKTKLDAVGAVERTILEKLGDTISIKDFGAEGDGLVDDTEAFYDAFVSLGSAGGTVNVPNDMRCRIASDLDIPANCHIQGPHSFVGTPGSNQSTPYDEVGGALLVDASATIRLGPGASVKGVLVRRFGMTFPAPNESDFEGTPFEVEGDDAAVVNSMILGFERAVNSDGYQRGQFYDLAIDCSNGVAITDCYDIPRLERIHGWPYSTIAAYAGDLDPTRLHRAGSLVYLEGVCDWVKVDSCFGYGYLKTYDVNGVNRPTLINCSADGPEGAGIRSGTVAFSLRGDTDQGRVIACQSASQEIDFYDETAVGRTNQWIGCTATNGTEHGFFVGVGNTIILGGNVSTKTRAITYANADSKLIVEGFIIGNGVTDRVALAVAAKAENLHVNIVTQDNALGQSPYSGAALTTRTLASASPLLIPPTGKDFTITGTTGIGNIQTGWAGREITLVFSAALTMVNGTGSSDAIRLNGGTNFVTAAGSTLTLRHNGTQWYEVGRSS